MRPPKKILLLADNEYRLSELRYVLRVHRYNVITADSAAAALKVILARERIPATQVDLLLVVWPVEGGTELLRRSKAIDAEIKTLLLADRPLTASDWTADRILVRGQCSSAAILEWIKMLVARKHGPRPGTQPASKLKAES